MKKLIVSLTVIVNIVVLSSCAFLSYPIQYKKYTTASITLPNEITEAYGKTSVEQIEWYMASSKEWEFSKKQDNVMARKYMPSQSYESYAAITVFTHGLFETGASYEPNQSVDFNVDTIDLDVYKPRNLSTTGKGSDRYYSSVTIKFSDTCYIRIDEHSYDTERKLTVDTIRSLGAMFADQATQEAELRENGSIGREQGTLNIVRNQYGTHDISGAVHLDKKNACRIRIVDAVTDEVYFEQLSDDRSEFYVGWSDDEAEYFKYYQRLTIKKRSDGPESADVKVQLWADDADGSRCVDETKANITFWVR